MDVIRSPLQGTVVAVHVVEGDAFAAGEVLVVIESMKMEHVVSAMHPGTVESLSVVAGDVVDRDQPLLVVRASAAEAADRTREPTPVHDPSRVRDDLAAVHARHALRLDDARPHAVERRHGTGHRTARENVDDLCDPGSFVEYGPLVIAAQRRRREIDDLLARTPADGLVAGVGRVDGRPTVVMSYDYTVLAGTQGTQNHRKKDRLFEIAERQRLPVVFFTEGGGGRPGDTDDGTRFAGLDCLAFRLWGELSGLVPLVGITSGRCFAGNAALLACCDVIIATRDANIGMGGPAMIEGGGLGEFPPEAVGPMSVQVPNGVVDLAVDDEPAAVAAAKRYLSYFAGRSNAWACGDQTVLRSLVPENRVRVYDVRAVVDALADDGSVLELRRGFGAGIVTALARFEGRPVGVVANDPAHLGGAIDADGADKAARFMQLCDAFDLPIVSLVDTPGFMVGPAAEETAQVRHFGRMFVVGASLTVPYMTIVLRKAYGLGAQAMAGGSLKSPLFCVAWPTGEFGGMGLEGAVRLGYRKELESAADSDALFEQLVQRLYEHGKAVNAATFFEFDDVIDPVDSRRWIATTLDAAPPGVPRAGKKRPCIDTW